MTKKRNHFLPLLIVLGAYIWFVRDFLFRPLWFDEALTVLNFALAADPADIYLNYSIPNNQICYTFLLRLWIAFQPQFIDAAVWLRLLSVLFGAGTLSALYLLFRTRFGSGRILLPVLTALGISVPFLIYATALRGYMLSALLVTLTLHFALLFAGRREWKSYFCYAACALLTVGTIPSNLAMLAGVVLYALPLFQGDFYRRRSFWLLAFTPPVMLLLFYLPIARQFIGVVNLGEGWNSGGKVLLAVLAAFSYSFAMLLIPATGSLLAFDRHNYNWLWSARAAVWLLPIPMALLLKVAPFPRVFFPFWPLWALLLAGGLRDLSALNCRWRRRWQPTVWIAALTAAVLLWGWLAQWPELRLAFSRRNGGSGSDDYFFGYYLRNEHTPDQTVAELKKRYPDGTPPIYLSFSADPWAVMFYGNLNGLTDPANYRFDGPRGRIPALPRGSLVILRDDESALPLEQRFHVRLRQLFRNPNHGVYRVD